MILAAASAEAANIGVNQTVDLTNAGDFNGNYINGYDTSGVFSSPFLVDISVGDNVTLNFTFAGDEEVTTQGLYSANVSVWTQGWNDYATVYSTGSLSFLDTHGNVVYSSGTKSDGDCCVHVGQFFFGDLSGAPSTMTFHAMRWTGTVTGYDGFTTRTYDDPNLLIGADSATLTGSASGTSAAPEPASWAMMLGGFGLVGSALRRRKVRIALA
jgi:hypothetical protein